MPVPVRIWLEIAYHPAFRVGGWAFVRQEAGGVSGTAGGEPRVDAERTGLAGLAAALRGLPAGAPIELRTSSSEVLGVPRRIVAAGTGDNPPTDNLELWAQVAAVLPRLSVRRAEPTPRSASAFAAAWADLARDRAKDKGAFTSAIPKSNLAKVEL